ncbi:hypothetical protein [Bacillus infantis]|uniref:hypothetical protein n=1 Tax=Bacillus infantis TaxID=324767 RepID=UPI00215504E4|nr:hypothetical protein [Bacillus infantis]MCR6611407.1 hypothetical protein [Bacillus infantis]
MKGQYDDDHKWNGLRELVPGKGESEQLKRSIMHSVRKGSQTGPRFFRAGSIAAACLLIIFCSSLLILSRQDSELSEDAPFISLKGHPFTMELPGIEVKTASGKVEFFRRGDGTETKAGYGENITEQDMNSLISSRSMYVRQKLEHFPYKTMMYIEHVKMMDTALRYHFFIQPDGKDLVYFTFDYPKFEYAEIFQAIASLRFKDLEPYIHPEPLYVRHGYGELLYPVGLTPVAVSSGYEEYRWEEASSRSFSDYLKALESSPEGWEKQESAGSSADYISRSGLVEVAIRLEGDILTYTIHYNRQE